MDTRRDQVLGVCVSGAWRGGLGGALWALPALAIHPGVFLLAGAIAAAVGSLLGVIAAAPTGAAIHRVSRRKAGLMGAASAVVLWTAIALPLYLLFDVRQGYVSGYLTMGPAAVGAAFGWWNAVAHHRSADDHTPVPVS